MRGHIVAYNYNTCCGIVRSMFRKFVFHSTIYHSRSNGWPKVGALVEIVLASSGDLLALHEL